MESTQCSKKFGLWQAPVKCFYSKSFYNDVYKKWSGSGLFFITLVSLIFATIVGGYLQQQAKGFDDKTILDFVKQVPNFEIKKGRLSSDVKQPYIVTLQDEPIAKLILDTTGEITSLPDDAILLITRQRVIVRKQMNGAVLESYDLKDIDNVKFDRETITPLLYKIRDLLPTVLGIVTFVFVWIAYLFKSLFYTVIVMLFTKSKYEFKSIYRLSTFALFPGFLLDYALVYFIGLPWALIFLINIGYVIFALKSILPESELEDAIDNEDVGLEDLTEKSAL